MKLNKIVECLDCNVISKDIELNIDIEFASASDLMSDVLAFAQQGALLLTGLSHNNVIRTCEIAGISAIIFVRDKKPPTDTIKLAQNCKIPIFLTDMTMFEACGILYSHGIKGIPIKKTE